MKLFRKNFVLFSLAGLLLAGIVVFFALALRQIWHKVEKGTIRFELPSSSSAASASPPSSTPSDTPVPSAVRDASQQARILLAEENQRRGFLDDEPLERRLILAANHTARQMLKYPESAVFAEPGSSGIQVEYPARGIATVQGRVVAVAENGQETALRFSCTVLYLESGYLQAQMPRFSASDHME